jgi:integrase
MPMIRKRVGVRVGVDGKPRETVSWQAVVRKGGHRSQSKTFKMKRDAEAWATAIENAINRDEFVADHPSKSKTVTDLLERYRKYETPKKRNQRNDNRYIDFWIEEIGDFKIGSIARSQIIEIRDAMAETRAPATVNRYLATLRHAWGIAETDWGWANSNPLKKIKLKEPRGRDRHLSDEEITGLLSAASESKHPHLYAIVLVGLTTGARRGEIMSLTWSDVDLSNGRALIRETKNTDKRTLALVPQVIAALREVKEVRRIDTNQVFVNPNNGKRTYKGLEASWRIARTAANLDDFRFHDLRHTFASRMAMDGRSLAEIAAALGHRTLAMVQRYAHLTDSHVQKAMEQTALKVLGDGTWWT